MKELIDKFAEVQDAVGQSNALGPELRHSLIKKIERLQAIALASNIRSRVYNFDTESTGVAEQIYKLPKEYQDAIRYIESTDFAVLIALAIKGAEAS